MTQTEYGVKVTAAIDEASGGTTEYPDSFEADVATCFLQRLTPEQAATKLLAEYSGATSAE
jgi:hypothetical protein